MTTPEHRAPTSPNKRRAWLLYGLAGLGAAAAGLLIGRQRFALEPTAASAAWLYELSLDDHTGAPQALRQYQGKRLLINFWATWCPPCVEEMPEIDAVRQAQAGGFEVLGLGVDTPSNLREFMQKTPVSYPILRAGAAGTELARKLGNDKGALPFSVLLSEQGQILARKLGKLSRAEIEAWAQGRVG